MMTSIDDAAIERTVRALTEANGEACRERALEGARCAASYWRDEDGSASDFEAFCLRHFAASDDDKDALFSRLELVLESLLGSALAVSRTFQWGVHVERGAVLPVDAILSAWSPSAHFSDDFFANKLAFAVHLNFPYKSLERKLEAGAAWSRRRWAEARLGDLFTERAPAGASERLQAAFAEAETYVAGYYLYPAMLRDGGAEGSAPGGAPIGGARATDPAGCSLFPADKRLLMHWNLRDEIKALYADPDGARKQRLLYKAMERVVDGSIPLAFVDSRELTWNPFSGEARTADGAPARPAGEGDARYERLLAIFRAEREYDLWCPDNPTLVARKFGVERELPEHEVERLFHELLSSPAHAGAAALVSDRLGRPLEAFDVWYRDFGGDRALDEAALDALTRERYPDARAFKADLPRILGVLGFDAETAGWLSDRIEVDQARGSGHAMPAAMRSDSVRLRTHVPATGMDYKGFNIACHELGHNVEQVFSLHGVDEYFLAGVPNNAFTEAFAFVFQARDLHILGLEPSRGAAGTGGSAVPGGSAGARGAAVLADYWATCEIAGVGLVDMELWRWLYAHPDCGARDLREAAMAIARSVWNRYFAGAFGFKDALVLGVYAHMVELAMYLPDYPLGHLIAFQVEAAMAGGTVGASMGRMCRLGRLTPTRWMLEAVGSGVSAAPLVEAAEAAVAEARGVGRLG